MKNEITGKNAHRAKKLPFPIRQLEARDEPFGGVGVWGCMYGSTILQFFPAWLVRQSLTAPCFLYRTSHPHGAAHGIQRQRVRRWRNLHCRHSGAPSAGAPKV